MTDDNSDLIAERDRLQAEVARLHVSRDTGVPVVALQGATTEEQAQAIAQSALAWKAATTPQPQPTAAVHHGVSQISRETLQYLSPEQVISAYRRGRLESIGSPAPPSQKQR